MLYLTYDNKLKTNMDVEKAIRERRSVREYTPDEVSEGDVEAILESGRWAPSGLNNQPWRFMVLRGDSKDRIAKHTKYGHIIMGAPVCIAVFFDDEAGYSRTKDMQAIGACVQNMLLTIHNRGLGGVWLGEIINQRGEVEAELGVKHELMAVVALGHPTEKSMSDRLDLKSLLL